MPSRRYQDDCVILNDDFPGYFGNNFLLPARYQEYIESIIVPHGMVLDRLDKMASDILDTYEASYTHSIHVICILKGGFKFATDLFFKLRSIITSRKKDIALYIDFILSNTYVNDSVGDGTKLNPCADFEKFRNKKVLIVEDLVDTGTSLTKIEEFVLQYNPLSLHTACLLLKRRPDCVGYIPDFVGFEVPNRFIVGYGIDYNDNFRDIPHVCSVNNEGKRKFAQPTPSVTTVQEQSKL
uniref:Phosphoribosyltransferase domain-containing protein n=1 Tax=Trichobilharzia regenti TaxID=157069 RepID=A0AA85ILV0_TRIRE|nr:unnamed protein product [Trichobilharzia regenti]